MATYYVVRGGQVLEIETGTFKETPTGDRLKDIFIHCKPLGEYSKEKIIHYNLWYIDAKALAEKLAQ